MAPPSELAPLPLAPASGSGSPQQNQPEPVSFRYPLPRKTVPGTMASFWIDLLLTHLSVLILNHSPHPDMPCFGHTISICYKLTSSVPPQGLCTCPVCNLSFLLPSRSQLQYPFSREGCTVLFSPPCSHHSSHLCVYLYIYLFNVSPQMVCSFQGQQTVPPSQCRVAWRWEWGLTSNGQEGTFWR